eukprot:1162142-Pelagomonas_calceolata.AAC.20
MTVTGVLEGAKECLQAASLPINSPGGRKGDESDQLEMCTIYRSVIPSTKLPSCNHLTHFTKGWHCFCVHQGDTRSDLDRWNWQEGAAATWQQFKEWRKEWLAVAVTC